jgi:tetratricopeptide (TPR) repeat protein
MKLRNFQFLLLFLAFGSLQPLAAQSAGYQTANMLMQQQEYEEALPILRSLYSNNPSSFIYFDRLTECLIQLKRFDEARQVAGDSDAQNRFSTQALLKLAEVEHMDGNREEAIRIWDRIIEQRPGSHQTYFSVGNSMQQRNEFDLAIDLYQRARETMNDRTLFLNELANTYMQAGRFEESVNEYFRLITVAPDQMSLVQQRFLRMRDETLYEIAAFELEDRLLALDTSHRAYSPMYQLLIWLLLETEEYERAFIFARQYENRTSYTIYSLFSLGSQLRSARKFELATRSYQYYTNSESDALKARALDELSKSYLEWGEFQLDNNLQMATTPDTPFDNSYRAGEELIQLFPNYEQIGEVYSRLIDISVDIYKDLDRAKTWFSEMQNRAQLQIPAYLLYAEGRIALFEKDFTRARQALTRADRQSDETNLSEKARYFLSLSDFFSEDYEFAEVQLKSMERRTSSYYANDAIKLRMWIKNGMRADTTGQVLDAVSRSMYQLHTGNYERALTVAEPLLATSGNTFADDLVLEFSTRLPKTYDAVLLKLLNHVIEGQPTSPVRERLLWDRAALIEERHETGWSTATSANPFTFLESETVPTYSEEDLIALYEEMLMEYPDGFYANYIREKLRTLESRTI